ncbi:hypothetical protein [Mycoplasma phocimorsus]|uniref:hypothetical protein n=1 Tax=Mycoplasma phocimorsus TaxID=3045839 RepID=UPI0024C0A1A1|nr:hypothetical protein [Mycoplasma phocimorsus]MDJ1646670.1 hypothetical protein [Mycoplasma phocimorsus]
MIKNKKIIIVALISTNIVILTNAISCNNINKNNIIDFSIENKKDKLYNYKAIKENSLIDTAVNFTFDYFAKNTNIHNGFHTYKNENIFIESNLSEDEKNIENRQKENNETDISKKLINELLEKRKKHEEKIAIYKKWILITSIASIIVATISSSLGIYFGIKNSNKNVEMTNLNLENQIEEYKKKYKEINPNDHLSNVIIKIIDIAFTKEFPNAILNFLKETILKDSFEKVNIDFETELKKEIKESNEAAKSSVSDLLNKLTKINIKNSDNNQIKNEIKKALTDITKIYLPNLIKGILKFITINSKVQTNNSIFADFLIKKLDKWNIKLNNSNEFSEILKTYVELITRRDDNLIAFLIKKASNVINRTDLSINIIDNLFTIINKFIEDLILKDNNDKNGEKSKAIDAAKIINILLPKIISSIKIDAEKDYLSFVKFVNGMFEQNNKHSNVNNKQLWVYKLIEGGKFKPDTQVYLENQIVSENQQINNRKIIIPEVDFSLDEKFLVLLELNNISGFITKLFNLLFEPLVIELKKSENNKSENAKKAIIRLTGLISFIYYKLSSNNKSGFFNTLKKDLTPADPKYAIPKTISKLFDKHNIKKELTELFGQSIYDPYLYIFKIGSYEIFSAAKKQVEKHKENISDLKKIFESGTFSNKNSSK